MPTRGRKLPKIMEAAVKQIKKTTSGNPFAIASSSLQKSGSLKRGTNTATAKGKMRGAKSKAWRHAHPA